MRRDAAAAARRCPGGIDLVRRAGQAMGDHPMLWGCVLVAALAILASAGRARAAGAAKPDAVAGPSLVSFESAGPLTEVYVSSDLECDVNHELDAHGEFFGETACGTFVAYGGVLYAPNGIPAGGGTVTSTTSFYEPVSQSAVSGDGSRGNPLRITSRVHAGPGLDVVQTDTYVVGEETLRTDVVLQNATATPLSVRVYRAGDCYLNDSDYGPGRIFAESGSIACASAVSDRVERWVPHTAGSHFYEGFYDDTWRLIGAQAPFPDTCRCDENIDNSAGLQWDVAVPANGTTSISSSITFSPTGGQGGLVAGDVQVEGIPAVGQQLTCATYGWLNARSFAFEWIANASSLPTMAAWPWTRPEYWPSRAGRMATPTTS